MDKIPIYDLLDNLRNTKCYGGRAARLVEHWMDGTPWRTNPCHYKMENPRLLSQYPFDERYPPINNTGVKSLILLRQTVYKMAIECGYRITGK